MKRAIFLAVAAVALVATPYAAAAPIQTFTVKSSSPVAGRPANLQFVASTSMPDGSKPPIAMSMKITGPAGAKGDFGVPTTCVRTTLENTGKCPASSQLFTRGTALVSVRFGGLQDLPVSGIKAYKLSGSGSSGTAVLDGIEPQTGVRALVDLNISKSGSSVVIDAPNTELPKILGIVPVVMELDLTLNGKMKKRSGKKTKYLYRNPSKCPAGGWTSAADVNYADGTSLHVESTQKCKPAKKKK